MSDTAVIPYTADSAHELGLPSPEALNLLDNFAKKMQGSVFLPKALANHPANILGVVLTGREMGFSPMQSLRMFWVSPDGRIAMYADAMMAAMRNKGFKFPQQEFTKTRAYLKAVRPDGETYEAEFTWEDAQAAGLAGKDNYKRYPKDMLKARVIGSVWRFLASDLGGSQMYTREEIEDLEPEPEPMMSAEAEPLTVGIKQIAPSPQPKEAEPPMEPAAVHAKGGSGETLPPSPPQAPPKPEPPKVDQKTEAKPPDLSARRTAVEAKLGEPAVARGLVNDFFRGCFASDKLPKKTELYTVPMEKLEQAVSTEAGILAVKTNPRTAGARAMGLVPDPMFAFASEHKWTPETVKLARTIAKERDMSSEDMVGWFEALDLGTLVPADAEAFFRVAKLARSAHLILDAVAKYGGTVAGVVAEMERVLGDVSELPVDKLNEALAKLDVSMGEGDAPF